MNFPLRFLLVLTFGLLLITCSLTQEKSKNISTSVWEKERCDTSVQISTLTAFDATLPFFQTDTLSTRLVMMPHLFMVVMTQGRVQSWAAVSASSLKARPAQWQPSFLPDSLKNVQLNLQPIENEYLWSLIGQPDYPYDRYEVLLAPARQAFLTKRDSMMANYQRQFPQYQLRVQSDLRGLGFQRRHLAMGKSVSPLGQHQFGLAADIGIISKGRQLQNIALYETLLNKIGGQYGLSWGGNFKGFVDPNHVQYFLNSSELLRQFPELRFEFEPYGKYFKNRVKRMTAAGKEEKVQDTKALLAILNKLHYDKPCVCDTLAERPVLAHSASLQKSLAIMSYRPQQDLLLLGNLDQQTITLWHPTGIKKSFKIGTWR